MDGSRCLLPLSKKEILISFFCQNDSWSTCPSCRVSVRYPIQLDQSVDRPPTLISHDFLPPRFSFLRSTWEISSSGRNCTCVLFSTTNQTFFPLLLLSLFFSRSNFSQKKMHVHVYAHSHLFRRRRRHRRRFSHNFFFPLHPQLVARGCYVAFVLLPPPTIQWRKMWANRAWCITYAASSGGTTAATTTTGCLSVSLAFGRSRWHLAWKGGESRKERGKRRRRRATHR